MCPYIFDSFVDNMLTNKQYRAVDPSTVRENLTNPQEPSLHPWGSMPIAETKVFNILHCCVGVAHVMTPYYMVPCTPRKTNHRVVHT